MFDGHFRPDRQLSESQRVRLGVTCMLIGMSDNIARLTPRLMSSVDVQSELWNPLAIVYGQPFTIACRELGWPAAGIAMQDCGFALYNTRLQRAGCLYRWAVGYDAHDLERKDLNEAWARELMNAALRIRY